MKKRKLSFACGAAVLAAAAMLTTGILTVSAAETGMVVAAPGSAAETRTIGTQTNTQSSGTETNGTQTNTQAGTQNASVQAGPGVTTAAQAVTSSAQIDTQKLTFDVTRFSLPADAKSLVVVEGFAVKGGKETYSEGYVEDENRWNKARVTAFMKNTDGSWSPVIQSAAVMGWGGMKADRHAGDGSTPIGLWKTDTAFGWGALESGFPSDYITIDPDAKNQFWSDETNRFEVNGDISAQSGERLYEDWAKGIYDYCLNSGFNKNESQKGTGSALFLHCTRAGKPSTAGCVAMDPEAMKGILRLRAAGGLYCAQAPEGQFETVYTAFSDTGAAAPGTFTVPTAEMPATPTVVLR